eukprot:gene50347-11287_t
MHAYTSYGGAKQHIDRWWVMRSDGAGAPSVSADGHYAFAAALAAGRDTSV